MLIFNQQAVTLSDDYSPRKISWITDSSTIIPRPTDLSRIIVVLGQVLKAEIFMEPIFCLRFEVTC